MKKIVLTGSPNVGKSVIFNALTGSYATVSNYPGTTVEVTRGTMSYAGKEHEIIDTPGMYSLKSVTEEEKVARNLLLSGKPDLVIQIADAKNIERMLTFTLQLIECGYPLILVVNVLDEAEKIGISIDIDKLSVQLGIPVIGTVAVKNKNIERLKEMIIHYQQQNTAHIKIFYGEAIEAALSELHVLLKGSYILPLRAVALLLLAGDTETENMMNKNEPENFAQIQEIIMKLEEQFSEPPDYILTIARQQKASAICEMTVTEKEKNRTVSFSEHLSHLIMNPVTGIPLVLISMLVLYLFVGVLGAQVLVNFIENRIFGEYINPVVTRWVTGMVPWGVIQDLFVNDYGIITLGMRYAVAIILPIVTTFFIAFSIIEDTGYLPRLSMLMNRLLKLIGLNGRAVIPIILGFGCNTMATMVTRTLETRRERIIASFLLALAIPCSAQLGIILILLAGNIKALALWITVMVFIFLLIGYLTAKILPGEAPIFYMEVPPLRLPKISNILVKTYIRVGWYFKEVFPLFIIASIVIWFGRITGIFGLAIKLLEYPVSWIGLPKEAASAFLLGFFRRDYGTAGLYDLKKAGLLSGIQLIVAAVTIAIFLPCIAQLSITIKERGIKSALLMAGFIFPFAFCIGGLVHLLLSLLGVKL